MTSAMATSSDRLTFFVGVNTGFVSDGLPDKRYVHFYEERSSPKLHCAIIGNVVVPGGHGSNQFSPTINSDRIWKEVAKAIRIKGSIPGIQLATAWSGYSGSRKFLSSRSHEIIDQARLQVHSLCEADVAGIIDAFAAGAALAVEHGFGHIQIHAAHGYLPSLLMDDRISPYAKQARQGFAVLAEWLRTREVKTSIRISLKTGDRTFDATGADSFRDAAFALPFDFFDLSSGFYNIDKRLIYPSRPDILAERYDESVSVAMRYPNRQFIASGHILGARTELPSNIHLGICRDLIANPRILFEPGDGCKNYGKCHYYSRSKSHVICPRWDEAK